MGNTRKGEKERKREIKKLKIRGKYSGHEYGEFCNSKEILCMNY